MGGVEWVGGTIDPKRRFWQHTGKQSTSIEGSRSNGLGRFYGRLDLSMHIVAVYAAKVEATQAEHELQIFWKLETDLSKKSMTGSKNGRAKLNEDQVRQIKSLLSQNLSCAEIGRRFRMPRICIGKIKNGKAWKHVK
jgi:predicted GIY-YIG superfamily endonuclease